MNTRIAAVTLDQLPAVLPLWRESMTHHAGLVPFFQPAPDGKAAWERHVAVAVAKGEGLLLAARVADKPVGLIFGQIQSLAPIFEAGKLGYISDLYVQPEYRRHGLGRLLFLALRDWLTDQGATALDLQAYTANAEAMAFWRKMGFVVTRRGCGWG